MIGPIDILRGEPDDVELAAVVMALDIVATRAVAGSEPAPVSRWASALRARSVNAPREWRSR